MRATAASIPIVSIVFMARVESVSRTVRPSDGTRYRRVCRFGSNRREVRRWEWEIERPKRGRAPVSWQYVVMRPAYQS